MVAGGIGQYLAQYMFDGEQPYELNAVEPNRFDGWTQRYRNFVFDKTREAYSRLYGNRSVIFRYLHFSRQSPLSLNVS